MRTSKVNERPGQGAFQREVCGTKIGRAKGEDGSRRGRREGGKKESVKQRRGIGRFANDFIENFDLLLAVVMKTANLGEIPGVYVYSHFPPENEVIPLNHKEILHNSHA